MATSSPVEMLVPKKWQKKAKRPGHTRGLPNKTNRNQEQYMECQEKKGAGKMVNKKVDNEKKKVGKGVHTFETGELTHSCVSNGQICDKLAQVGGRTVCTWVYVYTVIPKFVHRKLSNSLDWAMQKMLNFPSKLRETTSQKCNEDTDDKG